MKIKTLLLVLFPLLISNCNNHDNITERILVSFDFQTGYVWDSKTGTREPFTDSSFGGFYDDRKLTIYTDIYAIDPLTLVVHGCKLDTYVVRNFGNAHSDVVQPLNILEIWLKPECYGVLIGSDIVIELDLIYELGCPYGN